MHPVRPKLQNLPELVVILHFVRTFPDREPVLLGMHRGVVHPQLGGQRTVRQMFSQLQDLRNPGRPMSHLSHGVLFLPERVHPLPSPLHSLPAQCLVVHQLR